MSSPNIWIGTTVDWTTGANWSLTTKPNVEAGTAQAGAGSTITLRSGASATNSIFNGQVVFITAGTGAGQQRTISGYVGSTKVATVSVAWGTNPDNTSVYQVGDYAYFSSNSIINIDGSAATSLDQHTTLLSTLTVDSSYSGQHGSATAPLQIGAASVTIGGMTGFGSGTGSSRLSYDFGTTVLATTINILSTGQTSSEPTLPPLRFIGGTSGSPMVINSQSGFWGVATMIGQVAFATISITIPPVGNATPTSALIGAGATISVLEMETGTVVNQSTQVMPSVDVEGGSYFYTGTAGHTNLTVGQNGTVTYAGAGNLTGTVKVSGTISFAGDSRPKQITNGILAYFGATINLNNGQSNITADGTNPVIITLEQCDIGDITLTIGANAVKIVKA